MSYSLTVLLMALIYKVVIPAGFAYFAITWLIPGRYKEKFYKVVPLYPKRKYAVWLYILAIIFYIALIILLGGYPNFFLSMFMALISMITASLIVKTIAKLRNESLEESFEEEIKRKQKMLG